MPVQSEITRIDSSLLALQATSNGPGTAIVLESLAQVFVKQGLVVHPSDAKLAIRPAHFLVEREGSGNHEEIRAFLDWVKALYLKS